MSEDEPPGLEATYLESTFRADLRTSPPDVFEDISSTHWAKLDWKQVGRPYQVPANSSRRRRWEEERGLEMPITVQWEHFNRDFHSLFVADADECKPELWRRFWGRLGRLRLSQARETAAELLRLKVWNHIHRVEDAVWDPRGKRALFEGLEVERPRVLFLGAADGYEAMQMLAQYPGGEAVLVDYDDFCRTHRFGRFPERYPFLGRDPRTGGWKVWHRGDMNIDFEVSDIRDLKLGREFDIVLSVGLIEHFPDDHKETVFDFHRRFLKPGGYAIMTTPRRQLRSKAFYVLMADLMNYGYRELMDARQLGFYAHEHGFEVLRCGHIKAHNGVIARLR
ncbi:MAG TPA: class I SAM-dependent methyltransferase [Acidobacteriota bacterium]|nr:class I SAM-dependent methyltransferase [Acidobacteriota bacterium]